MLENTIALRVDVDTSQGLRKGIPRLLDVFKKHSVVASFFVVMGPDSVGRHIFRFKEKDYLKRIIKVNPLKLIANFGFKTFFYGTLIRRAPDIPKTAPEVIKRLLSEGHEFGIHSSNHSYWAEKFETFTQDMVRAELEKAFSMYEELTGKTPAASACPNWRCTEDILLEQDNFNFLYLSDTRGKTPFFPVAKGRTLKTIQIPQTMHTFHECLQANFCSKKDVVKYLVENELNEDELNVFTMHDWYEGLSEPNLADDFIRAAKKKGFDFKLLSTCAAKALNERDKIPACSISHQRISGGIGKLTFQETYDGNTIKN